MVKLRNGGRSGCIGKEVARLRGKQRILDCGGLQPCPLCHSTSQGGCCPLIAIRVPQSFLLLECPREFELQLNNLKNRNIHNVQTHEVIMVDAEGQVYCDHLNDTAESWNLIEI